MKEFLKLSDKYFGTIFCILIAFGLFYMYFEKPNLKSKEDLKSISGILEGYTFLDNQGWRSDGKNYTFKFKEFKNDFQISANHINLFDKLRFEKTVFIGQNLSIEILKEQNDLLNNRDEKVLAIRIWDSNNEYLNPRDVILREQGPMELIGGFMFITFGFLAYIIKRKNLQ